jgi:hypothetical protein
MCIFSDLYLNTHPPTLEEHTRLVGLRMRLPPQGDSERLASRADVTTSRGNIRVRNFTSHLPNFSASRDLLLGDSPATDGDPREKVGSATGMRPAHIPLERHRHAMALHERHGGDRERVIRGDGGMVRVPEAKELTNGRRPCPGSEAAR